MRLKSLLLAAALLGPIASAHAGPLTLDLPGAAVAQRQKVGYSCTGGHEASAEYVNAGANTMAILTFDGQTLLMVSVLSGSGAKYAGQQYAWWTKGNSADFYDLTKGEDAAPEFSCEAS